jgi:hypothetical protein
LSTWTAPELRETIPRCPTPTRAAVLTIDRTASGQALGSGGHGCFASPGLAQRALSALAELRALLGPNGLETEGATEDPSTLEQHVDDGSGWKQSGIGAGLGGAYGIHKYCRT